MRHTRDLLIATTNQDKFREIHHALLDAPFRLLSIQDVALSSLEAPEETEKTLEGNALLKAKFYGERSGMVSLADDSGLFVNALGGWPGVTSARIADDNEGRRQAVLERLCGVALPERRAYFETALCVYDPVTKNTFITHGVTHGHIMDAPTDGVYDFTYDPIFFVDDVSKPAADLTVAEKNAVSHRGRALQPMKLLLENVYSARHLVVPLALIVKNGKILMTRRNDPSRVEYHGKWEFPGGSMDLGETLEENVAREAKEEAGYDVAVVARLDHVAVSYQKGPSWAYQVYLLPFLCRIVGGNGVYRDAEVLEARWFHIDDVLRETLVGENMVMYSEILPELRSLIKNHNL